MTVPLVGLDAILRAPADAAAGDREIREAARQLEGVFLQQLMSVMRESAGEGALFSGAGASTYGSMFDEQIGDAMAEAGGIGLADVIAGAMGARTSASGVTPLGAPTPFLPLGDELARFGPLLESRPASGTDLDGATGALQDAAREMLGEDGLAPQWGREGTLTEADLASGFHTGAPGEAAYFSVRDARGFEGYYKCNLFALELTRRAGFEVPLVGRHHGWGYPGPTMLTEDAADGSMRGGWATVASSASAQMLDSAIVSGRSAFLVTGSEHAGHRGHMGVVERVHSVERDASGDITSITFDGWEGRSSGAMRVEGRTWAVAGSRAGEGGRGGLGRIEILELRRPDTGEEVERPLHEGAPASVLDGPTRDVATPASGI